MAKLVMLHKGYEKILTKIKEAPAGTLSLFDACKFKLFVNDVDPGVNGTEDAFTLSAFAGGDPISPPVWNAEFLDIGGVPHSLSQLLQWNYASGMAETVYGLLITDGADVGIAYARLDTARMMSVVTDALAVVVDLSPSGAGFGTMDQLL
jgi:hypothetical protein